MEFEVSYKQEGKRFSCHINKVDIYFSASTEDDVVRKAKIMVEMWIRHHIITGTKMDMVR